MDTGLLHWLDTESLVRAVTRVAGAAVLGGLIGIQRARAGKAAGMRTHMMVAVGAAMFILVPAQLGLSGGDLTRVIQGIAAGMGFLGAGMILKRAESEDIEGLTSAATIWFTGAVGIAAGTGLAWLGLVGVVTAWIILSIAVGIDRWLHPDPPHEAGHHATHLSSTAADPDHGSALEAAHGSGISPAISDRRRASRAGGSDERRHPEGPVDAAQGQGS
jgi:putative Mg2+ transporter-C (MgtC) family protein